MSDVFHGLHFNAVLLFSQPSRSTQSGQPSVGRWVGLVIRHAVYLNVDSPLSVASQCKLVPRAIETEIIATLWSHVALGGLFLE